MEIRINTDDGTLKVRVSILLVSYQVKDGRVFQSIYQLVAALSACHRIQRVLQRRLLSHRVANDNQEQPERVYVANRVCPCVCIKFTATQSSESNS